MVEQNQEVKQGRPAQKLSLDQIILWCEEHGAWDRLTVRERVALTNYQLFGLSNTLDNALRKIFSLQREWAKERLIQLVKAVIELGHHQQLTALERNYLELALGTDLNRSKFPRQFSLSNLSELKARAFSKIFQSADDETKEEVEALFLQSGLGRKSPFIQYEQEKAQERQYRKNRYQTPAGRLKILESQREYRKRPEVRGRILEKQLELYRAMDRKRAIRIVRQIAVDQISSLLSERETLVIQTRYPKKTKTLEELGGEFGGVSGERVRQIEQRALKKLQRALGQMATPAS